MGYRFQFILLLSKTPTLVLTVLDSLFLTSLLDLDTKQNMHNQNEAVLLYYEEALYEAFQKIIFTKILSALDFNAKRHGFLRYFIIH